ncbi:MAG: hypothetical protein K2M27_10790 [Muribaculaceae bacterium]|nr:hypothetical protein [Muribaculaceae bacterium]
MLKKTLTGIMFASLLVLGYVKGSPSAQAESELTKENIEALALFDTIEHWWNSKDYTCVPVTCYCTTFQYSSNAANPVETGSGEVAHRWNCTGCTDIDGTDCGYLL